MKLTRGEYCQFNLKSKINLLKDKGIFLFKKKVDDVHDVKLFLIYDFHVEVFFDSKHNEILKIEPIWSNGWGNYYLNGH